MQVTHLSRDGWVFNKKLNMKNTFFDTTGSRMVQLFFCQSSG